MNRIPILLLYQGSNVQTSLVVGIHLSFLHFLQSGQWFITLILNPGIKYIFETWDTEIDRKNFCCLVAWLNQWPMEIFGLHVIISLLQTSAGLGINAPIYCYRLFYTNFSRAGKYTYHQESNISFASAWLMEILVPFLPHMICHCHWKDRLSLSDLL